MSEARIIELRPRPPSEAEPVATPELSDEALLAACAVGDRAALGMLYDRHHRGVYAFLARMASVARHELDDLVQATFLEAMRSAKNFRGESQVHSWLFGIAANLVRRQVRSTIRRRTFTQRLAVQPVKKQTEPALRYDRQVAIERLRTALEALPHKQRAAYVMCELEDLSAAEAARALDLSEGSIWRLVHEAKRALRDAIGGTKP